MTLTQFRGPVLVVATLTMGLMAGVFGLYAHTIMRGLGKTDDRTFVAAFQSMDRAIINPLFILTFFGALVFSGVAAVLYLRDDGGSVLPWVIAAFALYLAVVVITVAVNVPLNDEIKAAGDPDRIADLAAVRDAFHETRWVAWNVVRAIASTVAFGCLAWALVLHGRISSTSTERQALTAGQADVVLGPFEGAHQTGDERLGAPDPTGRAQSHTATAAPPTEPTA